MVSKSLIACYCRHPKFGMYMLLISKRGRHGHPYHYDIRTKTKLMELTQSDKRIDVQPRLVYRSELMHLFKQKHA